MRLAKFTSDHEFRPPQAILLGMRCGIMVSIMKRNWVYRSLAAGIFLVVGWIITGCSVSDIAKFLEGTPSRTAPGTSVTTQSVVPTATTSPQPRPISPNTFTPGSVISEDAGPLVLTLWTPESIPPGSGVLEGEEYIGLWSGFQARFPTATLRIELKKPYGKGGMLNALLTTQGAAPSVLPDIIALDMAEVPLALESGVLQVLEPKLDKDLSANLYPFTRQLGRQGDNLHTVPFDVSMLHVMYSLDNFASPPLTWQSFISGTVPFCFPVEGDPLTVFDTVMLGYTAAGGNFIGQNGATALDTEILTQVFDNFARVNKNHGIPKSVADAPTLDTCWEAMAQGKVGAAVVDSRKIIQNSRLLTGHGVAALPSPGGQSFAWIRGWAYAVTSADPRREQIGIEFVNWLMSPVNLSKAVEASGSLPPRRSVLPEMPQAYAPFLSRLLEIATPVPDSHISTALARPVQDALRQVLSGKLIPRDAAASVKAALP
ncbi:MAG: extracellular solute-binding protein [Chloroflexi bacterium]|nr:extracellular solute-binding protein [Chloroflexota bacterium]